MARGSPWLLGLIFGAVGTAQLALGGDAVRYGRVLVDPIPMVVELRPTVTPQGPIFWMLTAGGRAVLWRVTGNSARQLCVVEPTMDEFHLVTHVNVSPSGKLSVAVKTSSLSGSFEQDVKVPDGQAIAYHQGRVCQWPQWLEIIPLPPDGTPRNSIVPRLEWTDGIPAVVLAAALTDTADYLATSDLRGTITLWGRSDGNRFAPIVQREGGFVPWLWFLPSRTSKLVAVSLDGRVFSVELENAASWRELSVTRPGELVVSATIDVKSGNIALLTTESRLLAIGRSPSGEIAVRWKASVWPDARICAAVGRLAVADRSGIWVHDILSGQVLYERPAETRAIRPRPSHLLLMLLRFSRFARPASHRPVQTFPILGRQVSAVWTLQDWGGTLRLDSPSGRPLWWAEDRPWFSHIAQLAWLRDGKLLCLWDRAAPAVALARLQGTHLTWALWSLPTSVTSAGGTVLALNGLGTPALDLATGRLHHLSPQDESHFVQVSPSGKLALSIGAHTVARQAGRRVILWTAQKERPIFHVSNGSVLGTLSRPDPNAWPRLVIWPTDAELTLLWELPTSEETFRLLLQQFHVDKEVRLANQCASQNLPDEAISLGLGAVKACSGVVLVSGDSAGLLAVECRDRGELGLRKVPAADTIFALHCVVPEPAPDVPAEASRAVAFGSSADGRTVVVITSCGWYFPDAHLWLLGDGCKPYAHFQLPDEALTLKPAVTSDGSSVAVPVAVSYSRAVLVRIVPPPRGERSGPGPAPSGAHGWPSESCNAANQVDTCLRPDGGSNERRSP